ncbi:hypothetical protein OBRU01_18426, partial [Operophtera brumata]
MTLVMYPCVTDHAPTILSINLRACREKAKTHRTKIDYVCVLNDLLHFDFSVIYSIDDANTAANFFINSISEIIKKHTNVIKLPRNKRILKPWITPGLLRCIRNRDNLHKKSRKDPKNHILKITFTRYRNFCNKLLRKLKQEYEKLEFEKAKYSPKATWDVIKRITYTEPKQPPPQDLLKIHPNPACCVDMVNQFFASIGQSLATKLKKDTPGVSTLLKGTLPSRSFQNSFGLLETDLEEVQQIIYNLRNSCAV